MSGAHSKFKTSVEIAAICILTAFVFLAVADARSAHARQVPSGLCVNDLRQTGAFDSAPTRCRRYLDRGGQFNNPHKDQDQYARYTATRKKSTKSRRQRRRAQRRARRGNSFARRRRLRRARRTRGVITKSYVGRLQRASTRYKRTTRKGNV